MVFDITSPPASRYLIENYQIQNVKNYFSENYYIADYFDFENFKVNMYNLYMFLVQQEPEFNYLYFFKLIIRAMSNIISFKTKMKYLHSLEFHYY